MQFKCPPCNALNDPCARDNSTTAFPETKQCDRKCCDDTAAATTCQPKTTVCEWCSPPPPSCCDYETTTDSDYWVEEDDDDTCYRSPQRSNRLFSPVIPTKPKPRRKRDKKGIGIGTGTGSGTGIGTSFGEERGKTKQDEESASGTATDGTAKPTTPKSSPTTNETSGVQEVTTTATTTKAKSTRTTPRPTIEQATTSPNVFYLKRRSNKKSTIDWRKPPKIPIKHTATSKTRNENWFADCGKYRVKAYRGDWDNLPDELSADYELYERFFKHRRPVVKKNTSLVKKLVEGKINLQKPRIENKPFRKRSPVLPPADEKPKRKSKLKSSSSSFAFGSGARGFRIDLRKQPLIQVRHTLTSSMRRNVEGHYCQKSPMPTYWHGSVEEMQQLKQKIDQRRGQLRNYWKKNDDQQQHQQQRQQQRQKPTSDSMNNLMVASSNPSTIPAAKKHFRNFVNVLEHRKSKDLSPQSSPPHPIKPTADQVRNFRKTIAIKVIPASKSVLISGHARHHHHEPQASSVNVLSNHYDANADSEKWTLPPAIPIRHNMTSILRQKSTNRFSRNALKEAR